MNYHEQIDTQTQAQSFVRVEQFLDFIQVPLSPFRLIEVKLNSASPSCKSAKRFMPYKLIRLSDETLIQVEVPDGQAEEISSRFARKVDSSLQNIKQALKKIYVPISESLCDMDDNLSVDSVEIEVGFGFEGEGSIYITKAKAASNLTVKFTMKPKKTGISN